ncbi:hypothetical protein GDO86_010863 [Hymenochirus boettgeri]|uniref:Uncharacterized protein n=1 Tax=Hymenochirus boettgeri TaxID=247094 RepID=A0A8T2JBX8_9PIPI|nr:hypothetical protein GDO86_010863 [Hymenochirus boettgeri]
MGSLRSYALPPVLQSISQKPVTKKPEYLPDHPVVLDEPHDKSSGLLYNQEQKTNKRQPSPARWNEGRSHLDTQFYNEKQETYTHQPSTAAWNEGRRCLETKLSIYNQNKSFNQLVPPKI